LGAETEFDQIGSGHVKPFQPVNFKNLLHTYMNQVSELLGSFGDNELSPKCLDGAQRFLKPDGISIPSSYWTFSYTYISLIPDVKNMLNII